MDVADETNGEEYMLVNQISRRGTPAYWIADDAGLGTIYTMVTSAGDNLVWSE